MSSYCDMCDETPRDTQAYYCDGQLFNWCNECVGENGYQGKPVTDKTCTVCGEDNLDYDACFNCKWASECINCCGCDNDEEGEDDGVR